MISEQFAQQVLGRPPFRPAAPPRSFLADRTVLVTGAGGSIASALCRRLARLSLRRLILIDHNEGSLQRLDRMLVGGGEPVRTTVVLGDVREERLLDECLAAHRPEVVFHTAAFKHVSFLEGQPLAAVDNNVLGTHALVEAASRHGVERCVLLSTDKAVNPVSIMGASKRLGELLVLARSQGETRFASLRLPNVLGSSGSVWPLLLTQIRRGQPLTLTHPQASRYFVTAREAVGLLLQSAWLGERGGLLVPDPGPPVRILDLARCMMQAASRTLPVVFTGLRPGEKLHEELHSAGEARVATSSATLWRLKGARPTPEDVVHWVSELTSILRRRDHALLGTRMCQWLPEYRPGSETSLAWNAASVGDVTRS